MSTAPPPPPPPPAATESSDARANQQFSKAYNFDIPTTQLLLKMTPQRLPDEDLVGLFAGYPSLRRVEVDSNPQNVWVSFDRLEDSIGAKEALHRRSIGDTCVYSCYGKYSRTLWVGHLPKSALDKNSIGDIFRDYNPRDIRVLENSNCAFITFDEIENAKGALQHTQRITLEDRRVTVNFKPENREAQELKVVWRGAPVYQRPNRGRCFVRDDPGRYKRGRSYEDRSPPRSPSKRRRLDSRDSYRERTPERYDRASYPRDERSSSHRSSPSSSFYDFEKTAHPEYGREEDRPYYEPESGDPGQEPPNAVPRPPPEELEASSYDTPAPKESMEPPPPPPPHPRANGLGMDHSGSFDQFPVSRAGIDEIYMMIGKCVHELVRRQSMELPPGN
eukprot:gb/GECH01014495.1/.p1 GENE.gb/GECH01014495.1/~~gb/GECH01014495.1/.p1  ORF type:complete len:391 (+),score=112.05 gb/GECH01014495.1/:1-1173(+)